MAYRPPHRDGARKGTLKGGHWAVEAQEPEGGPEAVAEEASLVRSAVPRVDGVGGDVDGAGSVQYQS